MHITRVELENIKSHTRSVFDFGRGSTAITGENGAGKTTIIEAIAWTLFNTLDYKKEDFLQRGAKKGHARVTFESGLDEREYVVHRDTGTGYHVLDPRLDVRVADKKDEVIRFLWKHLGVDPGTDLEVLFKQAIGVPQGTFTAVFLATAAERKKTFDTLLKVEEYRRGADELLRTVRYIDSQISASNVKIARAEGEIARIDQIQEERDLFAKQVEELEMLIGRIDGELGFVVLALKELEQAEKQVNAATASVQKAKALKERADLVVSQQETDLARSHEAAARVAETKSDAERHLDALARLKDLERERSTREALRSELSKTETAIANVTAERAHLLKELDAVQRAHTEIEESKPKVPEQELLEKEIDRTRWALAEGEAAEKRLKQIDQRLENLRNDYRANDEQLKYARKRVSDAANRERLEKRESEITNELARLRAALERDEAFQREIKNGLCPILSERCLNLKEGQTLEAFVTSQFGELRGRIDVLTGEQTATSRALRAASDAEKFLMQTALLEKRLAEIESEGKELKAERVGIEEVVRSRPELRMVLERAEAELHRLDNPKTRVALLEKEVAREPIIRQAISKCEQNLERLESDRRIIDEKLELHKDLDLNWRRAAEIRESTAEAYRVFVSNESAANQLEASKAELQLAKAKQNSAAQQLAVAEEELEAASQCYDRDRHLQLAAEHVDLQARTAEAKANYAAAKRREADLAAELDRLSSIRRSMQDEFRERERLEKNAEVTDFIRATLKEAAPLVARNYVYHVSMEANQIFRDITGSAERSLKWAEDYGIILEEGGYERPFQSLSGGEQMAAALAVRLALLKQLSDIRIAFFDEPTTNMDAERRENLAQQIGNIRHFDQLFVISHDDTFEGYMDHEIRVQD